MSLRYWGSRQDERYFGGHWVIKQGLKRAGCNGQPFTLLDVGGASEDSSGIIRRTFPSAHVINLDRSAANLAHASEPKIVADAFSLPFKSKSFDYVFCSSFLHHFRDDQVIELLRRFGYLARRAVFIVDIERHRVPYWFLEMCKPILKWHWVTVHDGHLSVRAAFRSRELQRLAEKAGLRDTDTRTYRPAFRVAMVGRPSF